MIEDALLFGLGFCSATLIALLCLPAVWHRANRLVRRRLEMLVPLSMAEIAAERDGIRANAAVLQRRLEQKLEKATEARAAVAADLGRRTRDLVAVERARDEAAAERDATQVSLAQTRTALTEAEQQSSSHAQQVRDMAARFEPIDDERRALLVKYQTLETLALERRANIASLETRKDVLEARIAELQIAVENGRIEQSTLRASLADRTRERDTARNEVLLATTQRTILQNQLQDESRRTEHYSVRWLAKSEALASAERRIMEQATELKTTKAALAHLKTRFEVLEARLIDSAGRPPGEVVSEAEIADLRSSITHLADDAMRLLQAPNGADDGEGEQTMAGGLPAMDKAQRSAGALF